MPARPGATCPARSPSPRPRRARAAGCTWSTTGAGTPEPSTHPFRCGTRSYQTAGRSSTSSWALGTSASCWSSDGTPARRRTSDRPAPARPRRRGRTIRVDRERPAMTRQPFNTGWSYREPVGPFAVQAAGEAPTPVTLPHDALRDAVRAPDVPSRGAGAYYPAGAFSYLATLDVPTEWAERVVSLEFQGAYRHAMVFVNDQLAGNRANGYARFWVNIKPFLRYGEPNEVRVEVRSGQDSRWYSGTGLYRPVFLQVDHP